MPDYLTFENWPYEYPENYWEKYREQEKLAIQKWTLVTMTELLPNAPKTEIAKKLGISIVWYNELRKKYGLN
jgi:hypothetical protein